MVKTPADSTRKWTDSRKSMNNSYLKAFIEVSAIVSSQKYNYESNTRID